ILEKLGLDEKQSHSTSIAIILPLSLISSYIYFVNGNLDLQKALFLIPFGIVGAIIGGFILPHFNSKLLKKIFGVMLLYFSFRMLLF
ncbi:MAG: sulfite exporter TauE/SafE family protein, partial [Oscillospiraceae bacterium]